MPRAAAAATLSARSSTKASRSRASPARSATISKTRGRAWRRPRARRRRRRQAARESRRWPARTGRARPTSWSAPAGVRRPRAGRGPRPRCPAPRRAGRRRSASGRRGRARPSAGGCGRPRPRPRPSCARRPGGGSTPGSRSRRRHKNRRASSGPTPAATAAYGSHSISTLPRSKTTASGNSDPARNSSWCHEASCEKREFHRLGGETVSLRTSAPRRERSPAAGRRCRSAWDARSSAPCPGPARATGPASRGCGRSRTGP